MMIYLPTLSEITAAIASIQDQWDERTRAQRAVQPEQVPWLVPVMTASEADEDQPPSPTPYVAF